MTAIAEITATDWSPQLGKPGQVVEDLDDINQCIKIILTTPKGSRPHEPLFGSDIHQYIDFPQNEGIPRIIHAVIEAVDLWEPRARLGRVTVVKDDAAAGRLTIRLEWALKEYAMETQRLEVTL